MFKIAIRTLSFVVVLVSLSALTACGSKSETQRLIIGQWQEVGGNLTVLEFYDDGHFTSWEYGITKAGTYQFTDDSHLTTDIPNNQWGPRLIQDFRISITDNVMTVWSGPVAYSYRRIR